MSAVPASPAPPTALGSRYLVREVGVAFPDEPDVAATSIEVPFRWTWTRQNPRPVLDVTLSRPPVDPDGFAPDNESTDAAVRLGVDDVRALRDHLDALLGEQRATIPAGFAGSTR